MAPSKSESPKSLIDLKINYSYASDRVRANDFSINAKVKLSVLRSMSSLEVSLQFHFVSKQVPIYFSL